MRGVRWPAARANNMAFVAAQENPGARRREILEDVRLSPGQRARQAKPIEDEMHQRFDQVHKAALDLLAAERVEHAAAQPMAQLTRAAFENPAYVTELMTLFERVPYRDRRLFAQLAIADRDLKAAYALQHVLAKDTSDSDAAQRDAILDDLANLTRPLATEADASLLALQVEIARLEILGWQGDAANPDTGLGTPRAAAITAEMGTLPREDGKKRQLGTSEQRALLEAQGAVTPAKPPL